MIENLQHIYIQQLPGMYSRHNSVSLLRLDLLHPVISGNKWFKLKYYLAEALDQQKTTISTFGGAFSNHIIATAYAAQQSGLESIGIIRGEKSNPESTTLLQAQAYGMKLIFIDREQYKNKKEIMDEYNHPKNYWIGEGGRGELGARGASEILTLPCLSDQAYTHILCATGTGTMLAGLVKKASPDQQIIGISVLKNHHSINEEVNALLSVEEKEKPFQIISGYHFGGYAKHPPALIAFMKELWHAEKVPTDIVYTSKLLYAVKVLLRKGFFPANSRLLVIHSGGLQGNQSLNPGTLPF